MCDDGYEYYQMFFVYVDDILCVSHHMKEDIGEITRFYKAKEEGIKEPEIYLRANMGKIQTPDDHEVWATSSHDYVKNAVQVIEQLLDEDGDGYVLKSCKNPFPSGYKPEVDVTDELGPDLALWYMQLIGILRWAVELGHINIFHEVSLLQAVKVCVALVQNSHRCEFFYVIFACSGLDAKITQCIK